MSELDYSRSTGRGFGQAGSLRTDSMSSMQRGNAINREVGDQKRETAFERRLMRQLGRASRKGDIKAGMLGREITLDAQARGAKVQGGIGSSEENRSVAAQSVFDRNRLTNQQDAATDGTTEQATPRASIRPAGQSGAGTMPEIDRAGPMPASTGGASATYDAEPPSPTSESSGGQVSALDRELLQYGARVNADLRKSPGFGSRPGYGLIGGTVPNAQEGTPPIGGTVSNDQGGISRPAPAAPSPVPTPTAASPTPSAPAPSRPAIAPSTPYKPPADVLTKRAAEDAEFNRRSAEREEKAQRDLDEGNRGNAELKASRLTENWQGERRDSPIGFNMRGKDDSTLTYAEKDNGGNRYRPKGWTQEDEDASARASETGSRLERFIKKYPILDIMTGAALSKRKLLASSRIGEMKSSTSPPPAAKPKPRKT
jgi:hypothetical protein